MDDNELNLALDRLKKRQVEIHRKYKSDIEAARGDRERIRAIIASTNEAVDLLQEEVNLLRKMEDNTESRDLPPSNA
jgi:hypothetical protein